MKLISFVLTSLRNLHKTIFVKFHKTKVSLQIVVKNGKPELKKINKYLFFHR